MIDMWRGFTEEGSSAKNSKEGAGNTEKESML